MSRRKKTVIKNSDWRLSSKMVEKTKVKTRRKTIPSEISLVVDEVSKNVIKSKEKSKVCSTEETNDLINKLRTHIKNQTTFLIDLVMNLREEQLSQLNSLSASVQHNQEMIQSCNSGENDIAESMSLPVITTDVVDKVDEIEEAIKWTPPSCTIKPVAQTKVKTTKIMQRRNTMCGPGTKTVSSPCSLNSIHVPLSMPSLTDESDADDIDKSMKSTSPSDVAHAVQTKEKTQANKIAHRRKSTRGPEKTIPSDPDYVPPIKESQLINFSSRKSSRSVHTSVAAMSAPKRSLYVNGTDDSSNTDTELSDRKSIATTPNAEISKPPPNKLLKTDAVPSNGNSTATTSSGVSKPPPNKVLKTCGNDTLKKLRELRKKQESTAPIEETIKYTGSGYPIGF